jgi:hypothetical protein
MNVLGHYLELVAEEATRPYGVQSNTDRSGSVADAVEAVLAIEPLCDDLTHR